MSGRRIAVVLFNLGGPDDAASVRPFLFNLFNDPAIIGLPGFARTPLAKLISSRREKSAQANYAMMDAGGGSPLKAETKKQMAALDARLAAVLPGDAVKSFIAMRYWHPLTDETASDVAAFVPDEVVLLPLYPQFSTTTTQSSLKAWKSAYSGPGRSRTVCCYPRAAGWIEAQAEGVRAKLMEAERDHPGRPMRVLFSAHGIPEKLVAKGDPYQEQIEGTVAAVAETIGLTDWTLCYQSRVGPLKWLGPSTPDTIRQAAADGVGVVVTPIAFVSEHIETLVELDIEYGELAHEAGLHPYLRAPAVGVAEPFIEALAGAVVDALGRTGSAPYGPGCQARHKACPFQAEAA
ncbi:ferrochelatase [Brevundimonas sp. NIBR11]|uniref:ferrochelatase n=1 Tax=Brevundimonas sp. NIBR11 TaxID=3015999 RepID=UPI0022F1192A|nr:ferrochelatase [Brevundimonas sp. NIBR11]WGM32655.1 Ferrochelatase [Brevundimonas sp. NIBR11]